MVRVRSTAEMSKFLEWEGEVPDEIPDIEYLINYLTNCLIT